MKVFSRVAAAALAMVLLAAAAMASKPAAPAPAPGVLITSKNLKEITGIKWTLQGMTEKKKAIALVPKVQVTLTLAEGGRVSGYASVNRYFGQCKVDAKGAVSWGHGLGMSRRAGPRNLMQQERTYARLLRTTTTIERVGKTLLRARNADGSTVLVFEWLKAKPPA